MKQKVLLDEKNKEIRDLENDKIKLDYDIKVHVTENETHRSYISELKTELNANFAEISSLKKLIDSLNKQIITLGNEKNTLVNDIKVVNTELTGKNKMMEQLNVEITKLS